MQGFRARRPRLTEARYLSILLPVPMASPFSSLVRRVLSFATRHPWAVLAVTGAAVRALRLLRDAPRDRHGPHEPSSEGRRSHPPCGALRRDGGETDVLVVAIRGTDLFRLDALGAFSGAIDAIAALPGITSIISPFSLPTFQRAADGRLQILPLSEGREAPRDEAALAAYVARVKATRYAENLVVSDDGGLLACFVQVETGRDPAPVLDGVRRAMDGIDLEGVTTHVTGANRVRGAHAILPWTRRRPPARARDGGHSLLLLARVPDGARRVPAPLGGAPGHALVRGAHGPARSEAHPGLRRGPAAHPHLRQRVRDLRDERILPDEPPPRAAGRSARGSTKRSAT